MAVQAEYADNASDMGVTKTDSSRKMTYLDRCDSLAVCTNLARPAGT